MPKRAPERVVKAGCRTLLTIHRPRVDTHQYKMSHPSRTRRRVVEAPTRRPPVALQAVRVIFEEDLDPDVSYLDQDEFADRRSEHKRGEFHFVGVRVEADVLIADTTQTLMSPGVSGIESDTDEEDLDRLVDEEWKALRDVLKTVGVPTEQLPLEVDRAWVEWRT